MNTTTASTKQRKQLQLLLASERARVSSRLKECSNLREGSDAGVRHPQKHWKEEFQLQNDSETVTKSDCSRQLMGRSEQEDDAATLTTLLSELSGKSSSSPGESFSSTGSTSAFMSAFMVAANSSSPAIMTSMLETPPTPTTRRSTPSSLAARYKARKNQLLSGDEKALSDGFNSFVSCGSCQSGRISEEGTSSTVVCRQNHARRDVNKKMKKVRFYPFNRTSFVESHYDMPMREVKATWYSQSELSEMLPTIQTLKRLHKNCNILSARPRGCMRGLELHYTENVDPQENQQSVYDVISEMAPAPKVRFDLDDYDNEPVESANNPLSRSVYRNYSYRCQKNAHIMGLLDEAYVMTHVYDRKCSNAALDALRNRKWESLRCCTCYAKEIRHKENRRRLRRPWRRRRRNIENPYDASFSSFGDISLRSGDSIYIDNQETELDSSDGSHDHDASYNTIDSFLCMDFLPTEITAVPMSAPSTVSGRQLKSLLWGRMVKGLQNKFQHDSSRFSFTN